MSKRIHYEDIKDIKETNPHLENSASFENMKNLDQEENPFIDNMVYPDDESFFSKFYDIFCCIPIKFNSK